MTTDSRTDERTQRRRRLQFSVRGALTLLLAAAVGFSTMGTENSRWYHVLWGATMALVVLGLANQMVDLCRTFHGRRDLSAGQRSGWRFAVFWRLAVILLFLGYYVVAILLEREMLTLPEREDIWPDPGGALRDALLALAALITFGGVPRPAPRRPRWWRSRWIGALGIVAGTCWGLLVLIDQLCVHSVAHVAIQGIGFAEPLWLGREGFGLVAADRMEAFVCYSLLGAGGVAMALLSTCLLARPRLRRLRQFLAAGSAAGSLAMAGACVLWLGTRGLPALAPMFVETWDLGPVHIWITALLVAVVLVTAATWRMVRTGDTAACGPDLNWRRNPSGYYHERRSVLLLALVGLIGWATLWWFRSFSVWQPSWEPSVWQSSVLRGMYSMLMWPPAYLPMAVLLLVAQKACTGWRRPAEPPSAAVPELPLARFCAVWIAMFLTFALAVPTLAAVGFVFWLSPWYCWHWLQWP